MLTSCGADVTKNSSISATDSTGNADMNGLDRYNEIAKRINPDSSNPDGIISPSNAMEILKAIGARKWYRNSPAVTVWSSFYNLTDKSVVWVSNEEFEKTTSIFTFELE